MQLDHNEELGPVHGMFGTLDAEIEVQRTIKRPELPAFSVGPTMVHVGNKGFIDGLWKCIGPKTKDADSWVPIWEELNNFRSKEILSEAEYVEAHRTSKERQQMLLFKKFTTEGNEKWMS